MRATVEKAVALVDNSKTNSCVAAMVRVEQLAEALKHMMTQQVDLQNMIAQMVTATSAVAGRATSEARERGKPWHDWDIYQNVKPFSGDARDWEEFSHEASLTTWSPSCRRRS